MRDVAISWRTNADTSFASASGLLRHGVPRNDNHALASTCLSSNSQTLLLVRLDARLSHEFRPARDIGLQEIREFFRRFDRRAVHPEA